MKTNDFFDGRYAVQRDFSSQSGFAEFLQQLEFNKLHFIVGCGFETRTTVILDWLADQFRGTAECTIVDLLNRKDPTYRQARRLQEKNIGRMKSALSKRKWSVNYVRTNVYSANLTAHRPLLNAVYAVLRRFSGNFLLDISSLPRSIALPTLRTLWFSKQARNLLVAYTEDSKVGALESQARDFRKPAYIPFFHPKRGSPNFSTWFPVLGSDYRPIAMIMDQSRFNDIYPVVGFPSTRPTETDSIVRLNKKLIANRSQNIIFASMNDPFQLAMTLNSVIEEIRASLGPNVSIIISPHGSKPQSVGVLMSAITNRTGVLYCQPLSYRPNEGGIGPSHLYWLKGAPYGS